MQSKMASMKAPRQSETSWVCSCSSLCSSVAAQHMSQKASGQHWQHQSSGTQIGPVGMSAVGAHPNTAHRICFKSHQRLCSLWGHFGCPHDLCLLQQEQALDALQDSVVQMMTYICQNGTVSMNGPAPPNYGAAPDQGCSTTCGHCPAPNAAASAKERQWLQQPPAVP